MVHKSNAVQAKIIAKAWKDPTFKKNLLKNPRKTLEEHGFKVPENLKVFVQEEKHKEFHFVLPPAPIKAEELSEAELKEQQAAGGCGFSICDSYLGSVN